MELVNILSQDCIIANAKVSSKRQLLQLLADRAAKQIDMPAAKVLENLMVREKLGSTGLGNGIAIPHGKLEDISGVCAVFARLEKPIDFDSIDDKPVDLAIMLLAPTGAGADHLKALALVARLLRTKSVVDELRNTRDVPTLFDILTSPIKNIDAA